MNGRAAKLRRLAVRSKLLASHLDALGDDLKQAGLPMCAKQVRRYAVCCMTLGLTLDAAHEQVRDEPGAAEPPPP